MIRTRVPSDRVEAAAVYGRDGQKIGTIERLMLEKKAGTVAYAVVQCGGFLKGDTHSPPPSSRRDCGPQRCPKARMRQTGKSKTCVWRWQQRFMEEGFDGLLHDKT